MTPPKKHAPTLAEERRMIALAQKNPVHFAPLYEKYYKQIFVFVHHRVNDRDLAADLVSQTFMKALLNIKKFEFRGFPYSTWLYRIATNEVNMHYRNAKTKVTVPVRESDVNDILTEVTSGLDEEQQERLITALNELPLDQSQLIELRFFEKHSFREIGQIIGTTEANAKVKVYRVLKKLKKSLTLKST